MNKINYQLRLDDIINDCQKRSVVPKLLLHSCCAPCSSYCLTYLSEYFHITVFYYNPNIAPEAEYQKRLKEQERLIGLLPTKYPVSLIKGPYEKERFFEMTREEKDCTEGGKRCLICYRMRLEKTAQRARECAADYFTTTLTVSPHKDAQKLNEMGLDLEKEFGISYLVSDFKKRDGYKRSVELSKQYRLYRQDYCGCVYSKGSGEPCAAKE